MTQARSFAASEKQLKIRMKSTNNIKKITSAMKMISTTKMKGDLARLQAGRHYGLAALDKVFASDELLKKKMPGEVGDVQTVLVPITSDKGLCGAVNSVIVRTCKKIVAEGNRANYTIFSIGEKGSTGLMRPFPDLLKTGITHVATPYNYPSVMAMAG